MLKNTTLRTKSCTYNHRIAEIFWPRLIVTKPGGTLGIFMVRGQGSTEYFCYFSFFLGGGGWNFENTYFIG